jgi:25S rRNA (uracil2634-N3)-methyltransferase
MAKKNLKNALRAHEAKKVQQSKVKAVEEALRRKALSIKTGKQPKKQRKQLNQTIKSYVKPFRKEDTILLVGEGNFSFAHSLLLPPHNHSPDLILATALDSEEECYEKYPDAKEHVAEIRRIANRDSVVLFKVDAGNLQAYKDVYPGTSRWSKVVFNFPHVGAGHKDESRNVLSNQLMLLRFLVSVAPLLSIGTVPTYASNTKAVKKKTQDDDNDDLREEEEEEEESEEESEAAATGFRTPPYAGSVLVTLRNSKPYTLWDVPMLAKRLPSVYSTIVKTAPPLDKGVKALTESQVDQLLSIGKGKPYRVWRSFQFRPELWPGYSHRRTIGWKQGRSTNENEDIVRSGDGENRTWELALAD